MKNHAIHFVGPNKLQVVEEEIPKPNTDELLIRTILSGISSGTEMLFYKGLIPNNMELDSTITGLKQELQYPFKYGYCSVGKVVTTGDSRLDHLTDRLVFAFHPHERFFCVKSDDVVVLPDGITPEDALFIPNLETALNLLLDSSPVIGENILILGLGVVGLLTATLLQKYPLHTVVGMDLYDLRRKTFTQLSSGHALDASSNDVDSILNAYLDNNNLKGFDLIYELTGNPKALNTAIDYCSYEGRIVLGSWYGTKPCQVNFGGRFHRNRIKIIASQVSTIASELQGRWSKQRRLQVVLDLLKQQPFHQLISHRFPIAEAEDAYELLQHHPQNSLLVALTYGET